MRKKGKFDPVTEVDHRAEKAIVEVIRSHRPDDGILAEEGGGVSAPGRHWIIDPMDGTVNFLHGIPQVSVSIACYDGEEALAGVVYDPLREELFAARAGGNATLNGASISVSETSELVDAVVATGFPYDHDHYAEEYTAVVSAVLREVNGIRRLGSAALDLAWTAAGRYEGYWELGLAPWDHAAGALVVRAAGGIVTDPFGTATTPTSRLLVAGNEVLQATLLAIVRTAMPDRLVP